MSASNVRAGGAFVEIFAKDSGFQKSLAKIKNQLQTFGQGLRSIGGGALGAGLGLVAPLALATKSFADAGSAVNDMAARTGLGTDTIQELAFAAKQTGTEIGTVERGLRKLQQQAKSAGIDPEEMFGRVADELAAIEDPAERVAMATKKFGKSGAELIPLLSLGSAGIAELREQARSLGLVLSSEDVAAADALGDSLDALWDTLAGVKNIIGASLAPALQAMSQTLLGVVSGVREFVNNNRMLVQGLFVGGSLLVAVGGTLLTLGIGLQVASVAVGGLAAAWAALGATLTFVASSPLLLVLGGVSAIALALPAMQEAAFGAFTILGDGFAELGQIASTTFGAITTAMTQGDMAAAADVLWAGLKLAWLAGTSEIRRIWRETTNTIASFGVDAFASFQQAVSVTATFMQDAFAAAFNGIAGAWTATQNALAGGFARVIGLVTGQDSAEILATLTEDQDRAAKAANDGIVSAQMQRDQASKDRLAQIEEERTAMQGSLKDELAGQQTAAENELKAAREALAAKSAAIEANGKMMTNFNTGVRGQADLLGAGGGGVSLGGFGGRNVQGIGGVGDLKQPIEDTAENTAEIAELLRNNEGLAFS